MPDGCGTANRGLAASVSGRPDGEAPALSLIVPCHNEAANMRPFAERVMECLSVEGAPETLELIFVDDGSQDDTLAQVTELIAEAPSDRIQMCAIELSRNFDKEAAMLAGLERATGALIGFIDADLQQDPQTSFEMYAYLQSHPEMDCVAAVQEERREGRMVTWLKKRFYRTFNAVGDVELPAHASDFRVFRRNVADALMAMPEYFRFSKGLFAWVGFRTHTIPYQPAERHAGETSWSLRGLFGYAFSGIVSFTTWPLRLVLYLGIIASVASLAYLIVVLFEYLIVGINVPGYPTLVCLILLFFGIVMLAMGVFGEYLGRIYIEGKRRPIYIARQVITQPAKAASPAKATTPSAEAANEGARIEDASAR